MWPLKTSRYLALVFAVVLAVVEAALNMSAPQWQYAPLWIIDYVIAAALVAGFWLTRKPAHMPVLMAAWALGAGVFYMALFVSLDPAMKWGEGGPEPLLLSLIGLGLAVRVLGLGLAGAAHFRAARAAPEPLASQDFLDSR